MPARNVSLTQLIKNHLSDDLLSSDELGEIRNALADNPEREAVMEWVREKYPGLVPLCMSTYAINKWGDGVTVFKDGTIPADVRKDIVESLGLAETKAVKSGNWSWNFHMDNAENVKKGLRELAENFGAELTIDREHKPSFSLTTYLDFSWKGSPEFYDALHAMGQTIQHRDGDRWRW